MPDAVTIPDSDEIRRDLDYMTARWGELAEPAQFELRAFKEEFKPQTALFTPDRIDEAVEWAEDMNGRGYNLYAVRNPIRASVTRSANDDDIIASFFLWADCDEPAAASNVQRFDGPKWSAAVVTGTVPSVRAHTYWMLETPCADMAAWRAMQSSIAAHFGSDKSVINPSRIMRVAGTVAYPFKHKRERGYTNEVTRLRTEYDDARPPVTMDQMRRVFKSSAAPVIDTGWIEGGDHKTAEAYLDILNRARTDGQKHTGVRDLAASLAGQGVNRSLAEAIIRQACPVWDENVEDLIASAYGKFYQPAPEVFAAPPQSTEWPTPLTNFDEESLPRRQWVYGRDYIRKFVSVVASAGGIGKTSNAIVEGLAIVTGRPLLGTDVQEPCNVWIVNLEDPVEELQMRALAARKHYGIPKENIAGKLFLDGEDTIQITLAAETREGISKNDALLELMRDRIIANKIGVVIIDPFIGTHLVNENSNAGIQAVVAMFRDLARQTQASICLVHHTRKGNGEDAGVDSVRGANSLIGAARAVRVMNRLSDREAERIGLSPTEARGIFRVDDGKANLAPPAESAVYRRMIGVQIANGEWVGVAVEYELPDEWSGMTDEVVNDMLRMIREGPARDDDSEEFYSIRPQDKTRWVGTVVTDYPFRKAEDFKSPAAAKAIMRKWMETGLLEEVEYYSASQRKDRKGVTANGTVGPQN